MKIVKGKEEIEIIIKEKENGIKIEIVEKKVLGKVEKRIGEEFWRENMENVGKGSIEKI